MSVQRFPHHPPRLPCPARACPWTAITIKTRRAGTTGAGNATATTAGRCARSSPARCPPAAAPPSARDSAARRAQVKAGCRPLRSLRSDFCPAGLITPVLGVRVGGDAGHRAGPGAQVSTPWFWSTTDTESAGAVSAQPEAGEESKALTPLSRFRMAHSVTLDLELHLCKGLWACAFLRFQLSILWSVD